MISLQSLAYKLAMGQPVKTERTAPCNCCFQPTRAHKLNADKVCPDCVAKGAMKCADCGEYYLPEQLNDEDLTCDICADGHDGEKFCSVCGRWQPYFYGESCDSCMENFHYEQSVALARGK